MKQVNLIFPHQLYQESPLFAIGAPYFIIEEFLFFKQYPFHKQKIAFHRASMKRYAELLQQEKGYKVTYIEAIQEESDVRKLLPYLKKQDITHINYIDPTDNWLQSRLSNGAEEHDLKLNELNSSLFINSKEDLAPFFKSGKKKFHQTSFYKEQRELRDILLDQNGKPKGGKWTYDTENRKKYPKKKTPPTLEFPENNSYYKEASTYVEKHFADHYGSLSNSIRYPIDFKESESWLQQFLKNRFKEFGPYEDAIVEDNSFLHHSVLTPMLNVGLLTPRDILDECLRFSEENDIPINSTEGFVRQILGWREFMRGMYEFKGSEERTRNFWKFDRKIPKSFYNGTTGILPLDNTIKKVLKIGYCHHIERLMILGNFMLLCEFDPDDVYQWFMELFIDSYDWVMVPNVYGMSQFADGGMMATKPYISGSNYIMKMSNYEKGEWQEVWDGLFWRFMHVHRDFFQSNPRLGMLVGMFDKMSDSKQKQHLNNAKNFISTIDA
ncbi:MAG: cryptochrome/photolyase family protein [Flavobacteriaceae bacterium]|nr:cryptochrome/photolyase family protein [Flavobacteriaceae bacterium]